MNRLMTSAIRDDWKHGVMIQVSLPEQDAFCQVLRVIGYWE